MLKHKYICANICKYAMNNIYKREKVISTNGIRKEIMNNNMKMKNTEYKMKRGKIAYTAKENKIQHENIIEHKF